MSVTVPSHFWLPLTLLVAGCTQGDMILLYGGSSNDTPDGDTAQIEDTGIAEDSDDNVPDDTGLEDTSTAYGFEVTDVDLTFTVLGEDRVIPLSGQVTLSNVGDEPIEVTIEPPSWLDAEESSARIDTLDRLTVSFAVASTAVDARVDLEDVVRFVDTNGVEEREAIATLAFESIPDEGVCVRPTPENTGPLISTFTEITEPITLDEPGVYSGYRFTRPVTIAANGITIEDSIFDFSETIGHRSMVRLESHVRCDLVINRVYATQADMPPGKHPSFIEVHAGGENGCTAATIRNSTFDGFWTDILGLSRHSVMENNYLTNWELAGLYEWESVPHGDAQQTGMSSEDLRIACNTFDLPWLQDGLTPNAALHITAKGVYSDGSPRYVRNVQVVDNFFNGAGGYSLYMRARNGGLMEDSSLVGNTFSSQFKHGAVSWGPDSSSTFRNNRIADNHWEDGACIQPSDEGGFTQHDCTER